MGSRYVLALVVRGVSSKASLALMQNPFALCANIPETLRPLKLV